MEETLTFIQLMKKAIKSKAYLPLYALFLITYIWPQYNVLAKNLVDYIFRIFNLIYVHSIFFDVGIFVLFIVINVSNSGHYYCEFEDRLNDFISLSNNRKVSFANFNKIALNTFNAIYLVIYPCFSIFFCLFNRQDFYYLFDKTEICYILCVVYSLLIIGEKLFIVNCDNVNRNTENPMNALKKQNINKTSEFEKELNKYNESN